MSNISCSCTSPVSQELKNKGELRINSFTEERISSLKQQVLSAYKYGVGIRGNKFSEILFGYQQALYKYEGIAYHFFGLVATKDPSKKKGALYLVSIAEAGKTIYPVIPSKYHNYDKAVTIRDTIDNAMSNSVQEVYTERVADNNAKKALAVLFSDLSKSCEKIANILDA